MEQRSNPQHGAKQQQQWRLAGFETFYMDFGLRTYVYIVDHEGPENISHTFTQPVTDSLDHMWCCHTQKQFTLY